jgi:hypothetical protein
MAEIFTTIEQMREHVKLDKTITFESLRPYITPAINKYLVRHTGAQLIADVKANLDAPTPNAHLTEATRLIRSALAQFALYMASPDIDIKVQEMGFQVAQNSNMVPASAARVDRFNQNRLMLGYAAIEDMLRYLEANKAQFTQWVTSGGSTIFTDVFIRTAEEFDKLVNIERSSLTFYNYRQSMEEVQELMIYGEITREYGEALLSRQKSGSLTAADNKVLPLVQRALANITHARHLKGEDHDKYKMRGVQFLGEAKKILWATPADYPEFQNSPMYFERSDFKTFENGADKSIFVAGG